MWVETVFNSIVNVTNASAIRIVQAPRHPMDEELQQSFGFDTELYYLTIFNTGDIGLLDRQDFC
jgi:hypothetical protein